KDSLEHDAVASGRPTMRSIAISFTQPILDDEYDQSHTKTMKIAISLPDDIFRRVDRAAKRLHISRSELLARAAEQFLAEHRAREVTESYDRAYGPAETSPLDAAEQQFRREAARRALRDIEW